MKRLSMLMLGASALSAPFAIAEEPSATPYRPTVSTPANLSEPKWLEVELGGLHTSGGDSKRRDSIPYTVKYAFTPDWGVRVGGDAWLQQVASDGSRLSGFGDTAIILKRRFPLSDNHAFGLEGGANLPTAKDGLGAGKTDYVVNAIYSANLNAYHADLNLAASRIGQLDAGTGRWQRTWAAALSRPLDERFSLAAEVSGTNQRGIASTAQFLVAASYNYSNRVVFDAGAASGLTRATPDWSLFAGVTILLAKVQ